MSDLTINVIKAIEDRSNFKEVLIIAVAKGFVDCDFFKCANSKEILESASNPNICDVTTSRQTSADERNSFSQIPNITELVDMVKSDWNSELDQILNINFEDYVESELTNDDNLFNEFHNETFMEFYSAEGNIVQNREVSDLSNMDINTLKDEQSDKKKLVCDICGKTFSSKKSVKRHIKQIHERNYPVANENCESILTTRLAKKSYVCDDCQKVFTFISELEAHQLIHSGGKTYDCVNCQKAFRHHSHLKRHQLIHSGEKLYNCVDCQKSFRHRSHLNRHLKIHSGEKPYLCGLCRRAFRQSSDLKVHERTHSGEKPYVCDLCQRPFSQNANLKEHQKTHNKKINNSPVLIVESHIAAKHI